MSSTAEIDSTKNIRWTPIIFFLQNPPFSHTCFVIPRSHRLLKSSLTYSYIRSAQVKNRFLGDEGKKAGNWQGLRKFSNSSSPVKYVGQFFKEGRKLHLRRKCPMQPCRGIGIVSQFTGGVFTWSPGRQSWLRASGQNPEQSSSLAESRVTRRRQWKSVAGPRGFLGDDVDCWKLVPIPELLPIIEGFEPRRTVSSYRTI